MTFVSRRWQKNSATWMIILSIYRELGIGGVCSKQIRLLSSMGQIRALLGSYSLGIFFPRRPSFYVELTPVNRDKDRTWAFQDPANCSPLLNMDSCYFDPAGGEAYEGSCWLYTFFVPQDMASLVNALCGPSRFIERLDFLHESGLLYMGDEQAFLTVFLYHYARRPALSARRAHYYIPSQFNNTVAGIPGNDDSGAMGSFTV